METKNWYPFSEINVLRDRINLFGDESMIEYSKMADPTVDIYEEEESLIIRISLGYIDLESIEISISEESIVIHSADRDCIIKSISLPTKVDDNKANIELKEGVIKIIVPVTN
ncbi:hypothetical protein U472_07740 [Orenia metallireducens]|jgi:HSP20 family protein|uniref:Hsp20/alpha crystallin family protein n=1 Tax=Orenia metallireducens TaxID=1413210 RepID=A0A1C0AAN0_9FIRM|nr:hypothetical protein [Orenia metallireducens]OCL27342.1 hypothetical protein U472_07740 [Orenia metallireducens]